MLGFSSFFNEEYYLKGEYMRLDEMSKPHYIYKQPIKFDRDDIAYLEQFPRRFWTQALYYRYHDDLMEALEDRDRRRKPLYKEKFKELYPKYLEKYKGTRTEKMAAKMARQAAQLEAEEYAARHPDGQIIYPDEKEYVFTKQGGHKEKIIARPEMGNLVKKLEKEYGDPEGYDLEFPRRGENHSATRGMNMMKWHTAGRRLTDWLNYVGHHMLGKLPDPDARRGVTWGPDEAKGLGSGKVRDTFTITRIKQEMAKLWWQRIPGEEDVVSLWERAFGTTKHTDEEIKSNNSLRRKLAEALGHLEVVLMAKRGELRTPPSPNHPNGQIVQVNDKGDIINPELYLPKKKTKIRYISQNGEVQTKEEEIPILLPGRILRRLTEPEIESISPGLRTGKHWNHAKKTWEAGYIPVEHYPYSEERPDEDEDEDDFTNERPRFLRAGAMHPNQNSTGRKYLPPTHPEYEGRLARLEAEMVRGTIDGDFNFSVNQSGSYFKDIVEAINQSINQNRGDTGVIEKATLRAMRPDLHTLGYMSLIENLDDPEIWRRGYRRERIRIMVGNFAQQDWGRGTRRLRRFMKSPEDREVKFNLTDFLNEKVQKAKAVMAERKAGKCLPGQKALPAGQCGFTYDLRVLFEILQDAIEDAHEADEEAEMAALTDDIRIERDALLNKRDAMTKAFVVLSKHFVNMGKSEEEAVEEAGKKLAFVNSSSGSSKELLQGVKDIIERGVRGEATKEEDALARWLDFEKFLTQNEADFRSKMEAKKGDAEAYTAKYPFLRPRWEALLNKLRAPTPKPQPVPQPQGPGKTIEQLVASQDWEIIPFTDRFRKNVELGNISTAGINWLTQKIRAKMESGGKTRYSEAALKKLQELYEIASKKK